MYATEKQCVRNFKDTKHQWNFKRFRNSKVTFNNNSFLGKGLLLTENN